MDEGREGAFSTRRSRRDARTRGGREHLVPGAAAGMQGRGAGAEVHLRVGRRATHSTLVVCHTCLGTPVNMLTGIVGHRHASGSIKHEASACTITHGHACSERNEGCYHAGNAPKCRHVSASCREWIRIAVRLSLDKSVQMFRTLSVSAEMASV